MLKQSSSRIKKVLAILLVVLFVASIAAVAANDAERGSRGDRGDHGNAGRGKEKCRGEVVGRGAIGVHATGVGTIRIPIGIMASTTKAVTDC